MRGGSKLWRGVWWRSCLLWLKGRCVGCGGGKRFGVWRRGFGLRGCWWCGRIFLWGGGGRFGGWVVCVDVSIGYV